MKSDNIQRRLIRFRRKIIKILPCFEKSKNQSAEGAGSPSDLSRSDLDTKAARKLDPAAEGVQKHCRFHTQKKSVTILVSNQYPKKINKQLTPLLPFQRLVRVIAFNFITNFMNHPNDLINKTSNQSFLEKCVNDIFVEKY